MHKMGMTLLTLIVALFSASCSGSGDQPAAENWPKGDTLYAFDEPDLLVELDDELDEISGLVVLEDGRLGAIQDEKGELYILDPSTGEIVEQRDFGKKGDYEAIEIAQGRLYILRSDGEVFWFDDWSGNALVGESFELDLPKRCDAEGLRYDPQGQRLLVSCKDEPGKDLEVERAIYAFDMDGELLQERPVYVIDSRGFNASLEDHPINQAVRSVLSDKVDLSGFRPSELAYHPITGELYILSSVRESIITLNAEGEVTGIWVISDDLLDQPEGMAFLPNGDLFIATEAAGGKHALLARFNYRGGQAE